MSDVIVSKAGGALMRDAASINRFAEKVRSDPRRRIIVPSAPGSSGNDPKMTDLLLNCAKAVPFSEIRNDLVHVVYVRFSAIISGLGLNPQTSREIRHSVGTWGSLSQDTIVSRGEYWMGRILAELLGYEFIDATKIIRFDENGRFDMERTRQNAHVIKEALDRSPGVVVPGFYGLMADGMTIKLFPRNATDLSAAIVADLAGAMLYEIWKERSVLIASPKIVPDAQRTSYLTYDEARALTDRGSEVVYPDAIELMRQEEIPVCVRSLDDPEETTFIQSDDLTPRGIPGISGISSRQGMCILTIRCSGMHEATGVAAKVFGALGEHGIRVHHLLDGIDSIDVVVESDVLIPKLSFVAAAIKEALGNVQLSCKHGLALITVVGRELAGLAPRLRILNALVKAGVNVQTFEQGTEQNVFTLTVFAHEAGIRAIYREFVRG